MWYFTRPDRPREGNAHSWYTDEISKSHLWAYLAHEKRFLEDWRATIRRYYHILGGKVSVGTTPHGMRWAHTQKELIDDLIDKAIEKNYLDRKFSSSYQTSSETILSSNWKGRNFLKPLPFFNAVLQEYGYIVSFLFGVGGATLLFLAKYIIELFL